MHPKYFATIGLPYQIQSACRTWERFSATLGFSTQTQSAIKEFESISSKFGLAAQIQGAWKDIESLSSRLGLTQFQSAWKDVERLSSWMGLPHFQSASKDFWGFSSRLGLSPQFRSAAKDFESFSKFGFLQSAAKDLSLAERVGVVGLASGLMGPTAAARAIAHLSEGSFKDTVLADLIGQMEGIVGAEAGDGDGGRDDAASMLFILKKRIFDGVQWAELNPRIREWLKIHYVSLLLFFLSTAITLFIR